MIIIFYLNLSLSILSQDCGSIWGVMAFNVFVGWLSWLLTLTVTKLLAYSIADPISSSLGLDFKIYLVGIPI